MLLEGKVGQFPKFGHNIGCHGMSLEDHKMNECLIKISHKAINAENLIKINPVVSKITGPPKNKYLKNREKH